MPLQNPQFCSRRSIPDPRRLIGRSGCDLFAIGAEGHLVDHIRMADEFKQLGIDHSTPDPYRLIIRGGQEVVVIWAK